MAVGTVVAVGAFAAVMAVVAVAAVVAVGAADAVGAVAAANAVDAIGAVDAVNAVVRIHQFSLQIGKLLRMARHAYVPREVLAEVNMVISLSFRCCSSGNQPASPQDSQAVRLCTKSNPLLLCASVRAAKTTACLTKPPSSFMTGYAVDC